MASVYGRHKVDMRSDTLYLLLKYPILLVDALDASIVFNLHTQNYSGKALLGCQGLEGSEWDQKLAPLRIGMVCSD